MEAGKARAAADSLGDAMGPGMVLGTLSPAPFSAQRRDPPSWRRLRGWEVRWGLQPQSQLRGQLETPESPPSASPAYWGVLYFALVL